MNSSGIWSVSCPDRFLGQLCNSSQLRFPAGTTSTKWAAYTGRALMMPLMGFCAARVSCLSAPGQVLMCLLLCVISHHLQTLCERAVLSFSFSPRVPLLRSSQWGPASCWTSLCSPFLSLSLWTIPTPLVTVKFHLVGKINPSMYTAIFSCPSCPLYVPRQYPTPETYPINNLLCSGVNNPPCHTGASFSLLFSSLFFSFFLLQTPCNYAGNVPV